ncbi:MAG: hypothetical protein WDZ35_00865 [Crocinitomicaceae bacterium]
MIFFNRERIKNFKPYFFEVIIIFIGITASFYFDEWRKDRERISLERDYLLRLDADLGNDISALQGLTDYSKIQLENCKTAMLAMNGDKEADTIFSHITGIYLFEINHYTITEMQGTGAFYSIEKGQLKTEILHYYHSSEELLKVYNLVLEKNEIMQSELNNHLKLINEKNNFGQFEVSKPIEGNLRLENLIYEKKNFIEFLLFFSPTLSQEAESLRATIKNYLEE